MKSTQDFIQILKSNPTPNNCIMESVDVEDIFTNVPVHENIEIIIENVYNYILNSSSFYTIKYS